MGHQHTQLKKIKSGNSTLIYGHADPDNCLRCGKHTPQMMYFSNAQDKITSFRAIETEKIDPLDQICIHGFTVKYCKYGCFERVVETMKNENLDN